MYPMKKKLQKIVKHIGSEMGMSFVMKVRPIKNVTIARAGGSTSLSLSYYKITGRWEACDECHASHSGRSELFCYLATISRNGICSDAEHTRPKS